MIKAKMKNNSHNGAKPQGPATNKGTPSHILFDVSDIKWGEVDPTVVTDEQLKDWYQLLQTEMKNAQSHIQRSIKYAYCIGRVLNAKKKQLKHGEFTPWVKSNMLFGDRMARNYMKVTETIDRLKKGKSEFQVPFLDEVSSIHQFLQLYATSKKVKAKPKKKNGVGGSSPTPSSEDPCLNIQTGGKAGVQDQKLATKESSPQPSTMALSTGELAQGSREQTHTPVKPEVEENAYQPRATNYDPYQEMIDLIDHSIGPNGSEDDFRETLRETLDGFVMGCGEVLYMNCIGGDLTTEAKTKAYSLTFSILQEWLDANKCNITELDSPPQPERPEEIGYGNDPYLIAIAIEQTPCFGDHSKKDNACQSCPLRVLCQEKTIENLAAFAEEWRVQQKNPPTNPALL